MYVLAVAKLAGLSVIACATLAALLASCAPPSAQDGRSGLPVVLTTFTVLADMTREVGGDRVEVHSITKPGAEIHGYEPTPSDLVRAAKADLVLENGMGLERWFAQFIDRSEAPSATLSTGITPIPIGAGSSYAGKANPHAWMSLAGAEVYVDNIRAALTRLDPAGAEVFARNARRYRAEIREVARGVRRALAQVPGRERVLVTCEGAFAYLARDLQLTEAYLWPVNAEREGTPRQIADLIAFVRERRPRAIFCESTVSPKAQQQVARAAGTQVRGPLYVDSLSRADGPVPTYLDLLRHDARVIASGLTGQKESP